MGVEAGERTIMADGRVKERVSNYTGFWEKDAANDNETQRANRLENYTDVINGQCHISSHFPNLTLMMWIWNLWTLGYYDGATELYEYGWAQSFHFSRFYKGEAFHQSVCIILLPSYFLLVNIYPIQLARHEHYLAHQMDLKPGMRVLDVGCGVGGPAREISRFADVKVVGLNNNDFQIGRARKYTKRAGLEGQVSFVKGDFMKLVEQFGEGSFDAGTLNSR